MSTEWISRRARPFGSFLASHMFHAPVIVFDTNTMLLPMDLAVVADSGGPDLTGPHPPISYEAAMFNGYTGADQDRTVSADFDVSSPGLSTDGMLWGDSGNVQIPVAGSGDALVFHLHGASGHRAQVVTVTP